MEGVEERSVKWAVLREAPTEPGSVLQIKRKAQQRVVRRVNEHANVKCMMHSCTEPELVAFARTCLGVKDARIRGASAAGQCCSESAAVCSNGNAVTTGSVTDALIDVGSSSGSIARTLQQR
eukprot:10013-Heterococcus_DN1.PRE.1